MNTLVVVGVVVLVIGAILGAVVTAQSGRSAPMPERVDCAGQRCRHPKMEVLLVLPPGPRVVRANDPAFQLLSQGNQGCCKCARCGAYYCYDCIDMDSPCRCGARSWLEGVYRPA
jgi:hypothetical protein